MPNAHEAHMRRLTRVTIDFLTLSFVEAFLEATNPWSLEGAEDIQIFL